MGLDVYCEWKGMTEEDKKAQYTGFRSVGAAGYLRQSWGSLAAWDEVFNSLFSKTWEATLFPNWEGYNGEEYTVENAREFLTESKAMLQRYIDNPRVPDESLKRYFSEWEDAVESIVKHCKEVIAFIDLALEKPEAVVMFR